MKEVYFVEFPAHYYGKHNNEATIKIYDSEKRVKEVLEYYNKEAEKEDYEDDDPKIYKIKCEELEFNTINQLKKI